MKNFIMSGSIESLCKELNCSSRRDVHTECVESEIFLKTLH